MVWKLKLVLWDYNNLELFSYGSGYFQFFSIFNRFSIFKWPIISHTQLGSKYYIFINRKQAFIMHRFSYVHQSHFLPQLPSILSGTWCYLISQSVKLKKTAIGLVHNNRSTESKIRTYPQCLICKTKGAGTQTLGEN